MCQLGSHAVWWASRLISAVTVSLLLELAVADCSNATCEQRSWNCDRTCSTPGGKDLVFDFRFSHEEGSCEEVIPWNESAMQTDINLWCLYPSAQYCREVDIYGWCTDLRPFVGCDNMNEYDFWGLSVLSGCTDHNGDGFELLRETCEWTCKHRSPYIRCTLEFDPAGTLEAQSRLERCSVRETCEGDVVVATTAMCEFKAPTAELSLNSPGAAEVTGSLVLQVSREEQVMLTAATNHADVASSISSAMSSEITGLPAAAVTVGSITSQSSARRLEADSLYVQANYSIDVNANASATVVQQALAMQRMIGDASALSLASAIRSELGSRQLDVSSVNVSSIFVAEELGFHQSSESSATSAALLELHKVYTEHISDAEDELAETLQELDRLNDSHEEVVQALKDKHAAASKELNQLLDTQDSLKEDLDAAVSEHESSSRVLLKAELEAEAAEQAFLSAQANLSVAQSELQEMVAARDETEQKLTEAMTSYEESTNHLETSKAKHQDTAARLANVTSELGDMRRMLYESQQANAATLQDLQDLSQRSRLRLEVELSRHAQTQADLNTTKTQLQNLRAEQAQLTAQLERSRESGKGTEITFIVVTAVMAGIVFLLLALLLYCAYKRYTAKWTDVEPFVDGDNIVVGRPVHEGEETGQDLKPASVVRAPTRELAKQQNPLTADGKV